MPVLRILLIGATALLLLLPGKARATAQIPDLLIVGNDTLNLFCNPLESYFDNNHPRPSDLGGIMSTACWRDYQATFTFRGDSLFLTQVRIGRHNDSTGYYPLEKLFGDKATPRGMFCYWVNETLECVGGKLLCYVHMGYASIYEFEIEYLMLDGRVKEKKVYDNRKSFLPYNNGNDWGGGMYAHGYSMLKTFVESQINYRRLRPEERNTYVEVEVTKTDANGRIKAFDIEMGKPSANLKHAIRRAIKKVPRFNVIYSHGKPNDMFQWIMPLKVYADEAEQRAKTDPVLGPDMETWEKSNMRDSNDYVQNLRYIARNYASTYHEMKQRAADTSAQARMYKDYFCRLFGDKDLYQHHYFLTLGDSALKYYYQYWDFTDDHESLYPTIVALEQEMGRPHNPKIEEEKNPPFQYLVRPKDLQAANLADSEHLDTRCRQVSHHLRGFGEGDLHEPLSQGIQEVWRLALIRGRHNRTSPVLVKVTYDGHEARLAWRVAKENRYEIYPRLEHLIHGIKSKGERVISAEDWELLQSLGNEAAIDSLQLPNDFFHSPPAIYNLEHRTATAYHVLNDYNHPYYEKDCAAARPQFWKFRILCKYLLYLADPELPFDCDDEK